MKQESPDDSVLVLRRSEYVSTQRPRRRITPAVTSGLFSDPNIWINNVEVIAAARIGMETVSYVSNIYKYYVAYKLIAVQEEQRRKARESIAEKPQ